MNYEVHDKKVDLDRDDAWKIGPGQWHDDDLEEVDVDMNQEWLLWPDVQWWSGGGGGAHPHFIVTFGLSPI